MKIDGSLTTKAGNRIAFSYYKSKIKPKGLVLYVHGFKGFKDWGFVPFLGNNAVAKDMDFFAFNFSHNGIGNDPMNFTEREKFRDNTFSLELQELNEIISKLLTGEIAEVSWVEKLALLGHSRGGGLVYLAGRGRKDISAVVSWAAVSTFRRYPLSVIKQWENDGYLEVKNSRTGQILELGYELHADLIRNIDHNLNILKASEEMLSPSLVVHCEDDPIVEVEDAHKIFYSLGTQKKEIFTLKGGKHTLGAMHPLIEVSEFLADGTEKSLGFIEESFLKN